MPRSASLLWRLTLISPLLCAALDFELNPYQTDRPTEGTIVFFSATRASGDPQLVNVVLVNTERGNTTVLFESHDLEKLPNAGFSLPAGIPPGNGYMVRMTDTTAGRRTLAESDRFQIYPPGTPPSSTAETSERMTATVLTNTVPGAGATQPPATSSDTPSPVPVGAIVGGALGGVALLVVFGILLYCIRRQGRPVTVEELERKQQKAQKKKQEKDVISPFLLSDPTPSSAYPSTPNSTTAILAPQRRSQSEANAAHFDTSARAEKARLANNTNYFTPTNVERLPTELSANSTIGEGSSQYQQAGSSSASDNSKGNQRTHRRKRSKPRKAELEEYELSSTTGSSTVVARSEELRRERDRLDKEISELERRTSMGGSKTPRRHNTDNDEMLAQLEQLRERMHALDSTAGSQRRPPLPPTPSEPPPEYYPGSNIGHGSRR